MVNILKYSQCRQNLFSVVYNAQDKKVEFLKYNKYSIYKSILWSDDFKIMNFRMNLKLLMVDSNDLKLKYMFNIWS